MGFRLATFFRGAVFGFKVSAADDDDDDYDDEDDDDADDADDDDDDDVDDVEAVETASCKKHVLLIDVWK